MGEMPAEIPEGGLAQLVGDIATARSDWHNKTLRLARWPSQANFENFHGSFNDLMHKMHLTVEHVLSGSEPEEEKASIIASLLIEETGHRIATYNDVVGDNIFSLQKHHESLSEDIFKELTLAQCDHPAECIISEYGESATEELDEVCELIGQGSGAKKFKIAQALGRHGLDVVKIASGVVVGLGIAAKLFDRKR